MYPSVLAPFRCTRPDESIECTYESIGVDLQKLEGVSTEEVGEGADRDGEAEQPVKSQ
jgi:hypothetical protein